MLNAAWICRWTFWRRESVCPCCCGVAALGYNYKKRIRVAFPNRLKVAVSIFLERGSINPA